jgi:hypothetical protein
VHSHQPSTQATWTTGYKTHCAPTPPSRRLLQRLFTTVTVILLHNHDNLHWGLSITIRKATHHRILYLDQLNLRYLAIEDDLIHFWTRSTRAAYALLPHTTIHHL